MVCGNVTRPVEQPAICSSSLPLPSLPPILSFSQWQVGGISVEMNIKTGKSSSITFGDTLFTRRWHRWMSSSRWCHRTASSNKQIDEARWTVLATLFRLVTRREKRVGRVSNSHRRKKTNFEWGREWGHRQDAVRMGAIVTRLCVRAYKVPDKIAWRAVIY